MAHLIKNIKGFNKIEKIWFKGINIPYKVISHNNRFAVCVASKGPLSIYSIAFIDLKENTVSRGTETVDQNNEMLTILLRQLEKGKASLNPKQTYPLEVVKILYSGNIY